MLLQIASGNLCETAISPVILVPLKRICRP